MIEPLARGIDPAQLAFQSLASMGARTERTPSVSPLAVALDRLGVDLAHGERFTTAEAREFVSLVRTTLEVLEAVAPAAAQSERSGAPLQTVQYAMRDLQRALTQVLTAHHDFTTTLAPILREVLVAMQEIATLPPGPRTTVPASVEEPRVPAEANRAIVGDRSPPTLASLVSSLVASIARLQAVLPLQAAPSADPAPTGAVDVTSVNGTKPNMNGRGDTSTSQVDRSDAPLSVSLTKHALAAPTIKMLQTLVKAIAELLTLLPLAATPAPLRPESASHLLQNLARVLREATVLLEGVLAEPAAQTPAGSVPIEPAHVPRAATSGPGSTPLSPPPSTARLGAEAVRVIGLVHELLTSPTTAPLPRPVAQASQPVVAGVVEVPVPLPVALAGLPAPLVAILAEVIVDLKAAVPAALLEAGAADESAPLMTAIQLAQLQATARPDVVLAGTPGMAVNPLETLDAYRWGLLVALNYRPAVGRPTPARVSLTRPRCELCNRLLEQTRSGALVCPSC